ncbi:hypothetical protein TUN199_04625 [Pyrenophora tritici-repentis]|nr:hypothetical protein Alg215_03810 [Pyrenophora tritici-repentis]KAI0584655.1 hypothetical protein Alg130_05125 [Pyrenophora tritici-repentis]KAI0623382.1 hypothetical protein TUN199_04625 [Pyrenophora tritici-repentis]PZC97326.1 hypothetical protein A1F95_04842 [Pyrenophora tritici-repentis]
MSNGENSQYQGELSGYEMGDFSNDAYFKDTGIDMSDSPTDMVTGQPGGIQGGDWAPPPTSQGPQYRAAGAGEEGEILSASQFQALELAVSKGTEVLLALPPEPAAPAFAAPVFTAPVVAAKKAGKPRATKAKEPKKITARVTKPTKTSTKVVKPKKVTKKMERTITELFAQRWTDLTKIEKGRIVDPLVHGIDPMTGAKIGAAGAFLPPPDYEWIGKDLFNTGTANLLTAGRSVDTKDDPSAEKKRIEGIARRILAANKSKMMPERISAISSSPAANIVTSSPYQANIIGNNNAVDLTSADTSSINGGFQNIDTSRNTGELTAQSSTTPNFSNAFSNHETLNNSTSCGTVNTNSFNGINLGAFEPNTVNFDLNAGFTPLDANNLSSDMFGITGFTPLDTDQLSSNSFTVPGTNDYTYNLSADVFGTEGPTTIDPRNLSSGSSTMPDANNSSSDSVAASSTNSSSPDSFTPLDTNYLSSDTFTVPGDFDPSSDVCEMEATVDAIIAGEYINKPLILKTTTGTQGRSSTKSGKGFHGNLGGPCGNGIIGPNGVITVPPQVPTDPSAYGLTRQKEALQRNAMLRAQGRRR